MNTLPPLPVHVCAKSVLTFDAAASPKRKSIDIAASGA